MCLKSLRKKPYDFEPKNLGEHIRKRRLELGLTQKQVGDRLGVNPWTVLNWEKGKTEPPITFTPAILQFLGYDPFPASKTLPERLFALRRSRGWLIRDAAKEFGVDAGTWRDWECGKTILYRRHRQLIARLLGLPCGEIHQEMGAQWNRSHSKKLSGEL
ncbi:MAG: helix-turn-helix domain-containing protein [Pseudomonadota bacterium]